MITNLNRKQMDFLVGEVRLHRFIFLAAIIIYAITAFYSTGYYHADEHYQIIEFAGAKSGDNTVDEQAWEFKAMSRQTIQPAIAYVIFSILKVLNVTDPYYKALVLRLLTAALALIVIHLFVRTSLSSVDPKFRFLYLFMSYFLWFVPAVNVRFSSETWSGLMFLLAVTILNMKQLQTRHRYFVFGLVAGLGFLFRFQSVFLFLGLIAWLVFVQRISFRNDIQIIAGGLLVQFAGILIDTWFYGSFVVTFWEYFNKQIIEDIASEFGTEVWYYYLKEMIIAPYWPFGVVIVISFLVLLIKSARNYLVWSILPFLILHSVIPHKEVRFLLPLVNLVPLIIVLGLQSIRYEIIFQRSRRLAKVFIYLILVMFFILNIIGLAAFSLKPAGNGKMEISRYIAEEFNEKPVRLIHCSWSSPYNPFESVPTKFYQRSNVEDIRIVSLCQLNDSLLSNSKVNLLVLRQIELKSQRCQIILQNYKTVELKRSIPVWIENLNTFYGEMNTDDVLILFLIQ